MMKHRVRFLVFLPVLVYVGLEIIRSIPSVHPGFVPLKKFKNIGIANIYILFRFFFKYFEYFHGCAKGPVKFPKPPWTRNEKDILLLRPFNQDCNRGTNFPSFIYFRFKSLTRV